MSKQRYTHASPTLFSAGKEKGNLSSCVLIAIKGDSIDGIYDTLKDTAKYSAAAAGESIWLDPIRATGSYIASSGGESEGVLKMCRVFNNSNLYVGQGGGKRKGALAVHLSVWHADIEQFIEMSDKDGAEETRCHSLFTGVIIPDLFMKRLEKNKSWSLFCPTEAPMLLTTYGDEFEKWYLKYEKDGLARKTLPARKLNNLMRRIEPVSGLPYKEFIDAINKTSNQKNLGKINHTNLCTEILQRTSSDRIATCNLASINLTAYVTQKASLDGTVQGVFDYDQLGRDVEDIQDAVNDVIDANYNVLPEAAASNEDTRPMGIGIQGFQNVLFEMRFPFDSEEAARMNQKIIERISFHATRASMIEAKRSGPYPLFEGSPLSQGKFQMDLHERKPIYPLDPANDWETLRQDVMKHGVRNSLLIALMPTATTSQFLGNIESFEPQHSNIYNRRTLAGDYGQYNYYLEEDLIELGIWTPTMRDRIRVNQGSIQRFPDIPVKLQKLYKTIYEIKQKTLIDLASNRALWVCHSQSLNLYPKSTREEDLTALFYYAWKMGLSTLYYMRPFIKMEMMNMTKEQLSYIIPELTEEEEGTPSKTRAKKRVTLQVPDRLEPHQEQEELLQAIKRSRSGELNYLNGGRRYYTLDKNLKYVERQPSAPLSPVEEETKLEEKDVRQEAPTSKRIKIHIDSPDGKRQGTKRSRSPERQQHEEEVQTNGNHKKPKSDSTSSVSGEEVATKPLSPPALLTAAQVLARANDPDFKEGLVDETCTRNNPECTACLS